MSVSRISLRIASDFGRVGRLIYVAEVSRKPLTMHGKIAASEKLCVRMKRPK